MSLFEDVSTLFAAAITDGQDNEAIVKAAYEDLLGYADADTMNNSAARIDYWVQKLSSGELTTDNFGGSFLEEANTNQGSLISSTTFENNQTVVAAHEDAYEANPDVTLEDLTAVAAENRVEDVAEEDEGVTGETFTLTTSIDNFTGTADDDTFEQTKDGQLSIDDTLDGGAGDDVLYIRDQNGDTGAFTASNIETIDARDDTNTAKVELDNVSGYTTLAANALGAQLTFSEVTNSDDLVLEAKNMNADQSAVFTFADDELDGESDAVNLRLDGNTNTFQVDINAGNGAIETLNVDAASDSTGSIDLSGGDVEGVETLNISGAGDVDLTKSTTFTSETVDAAAAEGDVTLALGDENQTVTGGSGDDTFAFGSDLSSDDTVDGGAGVDTISVDTSSGSVVDGSTDGAFENVSNFETIALSAAAADGGALVVDVAKKNDLENVVFELSHTHDNGSNATRVKGLTSNSTVTLQDAADSASDEIYFVDAENTSSDKLNLVLEDDADGANANNNVGELHQGTGTNYETVVIDAKDADTTENNEVYDIDVSALNVAAVTVTGQNAVNLTEDGSVTLSSQTSTINAGNAEAAVKVLASDGASLEATGGSGDDVLMGNGDAADILDGGAGDDSLVGLNGGDTLTGGKGDDIFLFQAEGNDPVTITDFSQTSNNDDTMFFDIGKTKSDNTSAFTNRMAKTGTSSTSGLFQYAQTGSGSIGTAKGLITTTDAGGGAKTLTGVGLRLLRTDTTQIDIPYLGSTANGVAETFAVGSSLVFTGFSAKAGTSSSALVSALTGALTATIKNGDASTATGSFAALFTTADSGGLFAAKVSNGGGALVTGDIKSIATIATLGVNYSYEAGDIVLM